MLVFLFRPRNRALAIRKLKDLRNKHLCALWQATPDDARVLEVQANIKGRE